MYIGLIATSFTTVLALLIMFFNKKFNAVFSSYYFYLFTSILWIIYFIIFRWKDDVIDWINNNDNKYVGGIDVVKSKVLLLDLCPFISMFLPICLIIDKKRKWVQSIAYFGIVGGCITIYGQIAFEAIGSHASSISLEKTTWYEYLFMNKLYFLMHFYIFIFSLIIILNSQSMNWKRVIISHVFAISYFVYISIIVFTLNISRNATGIVHNDWLPSGEYEVIGSIINLPWPLQPIVCFVLVWVWVILMMILRNTLVMNPNYISKDQINVPYLRNWVITMHNSYFMRKK